MSRQNEAPDRGFIARHSVGDVLQGTVVSVVPFGVFVEVAEGIHGLVHESESNERPATGAPLQVEILAIDAAQARLSLRPA